MVSGGVGAARFLAGLIDAVETSTTFPAPRPSRPSSTPATTARCTACRSRPISTPSRTRWPEPSTPSAAGGSSTSRGGRWKPSNATSAVRPAGSSAAPTLVQPRRPGPGDPLLPHGSTRRGCVADRGHRRDPPRLAGSRSHRADDRRPAEHDRDRHRRARASRRGVVPGLLRPTAPLGARHVRALRRRRPSSPARPDRRSNRPTRS